MTEPDQEDTVYYIKTDAPINKDSVLEDDGSYLTPQNKIAPSHPAPEDIERQNEDVQSDRSVIKLKCVNLFMLYIAQKYLPKICT